MYISNTDCKKETLHYGFKICFHILKKLKICLEKNFKSIYADFEEGEYEYQN